MKRGLAVAVVACALLGAALSGCGNQDGSLVNYVPEGTVSDAMLITDVQPDTRLTVVFTDTLSNTGDSLDTFEFTGGSSTFPAGTAFQVFRSDGTTPISDTNGNFLNDTGPMNPGDQTRIVIHAILPGGVAGGPFEANLTASSVTDIDVSASAHNVLGEIFPTAPSGITIAAVSGPLGETLVRSATGPVAGGAGMIKLERGASHAAPASVNANPALTFVGETIAQAWPTFSNQILVTGLVLDNSVANGFRLYANPAGQGFRPAEDFVAAPSASWITGWNLYSIRLTTFDPAAGTDLMGRGARNGIESSAAPITEHSYLPASTPEDLIHRLDVILVSPGDSTETDSIPVLTWNATPGASRKPPTVRRISTH